MKLVDTHAHLDMDHFDRDRDDVIERARDSGVEIIVNASFDLDSARAATALAEKHPGIYALAGIHPHDAGGVPRDYMARLQELAGHPGVVAIGEIGLDYYRNLSPRGVQQVVFREQLALAVELDLPVVIHDRDAHGDVMDIIRRDRVPGKGGVMHCFSGSWDMAAELLKKGFYISLAGPVTFPNAARLKDIAARLPLDRILVETDCPYLAPQAHRGKRNEPAYVRHVVLEVARLRNMIPERLAETTAANAKKAFGLL